MGQKHKEKVPKKIVDPVGTFPQITSVCKIKDVVYNKKGRNPHLGKFDVSEDQARILESLAQSGEVVNLIISTRQGHFPETQ